MAGEGIIANGVNEILKKLSFVVAHEITLVWDVNNQLKNLQTMLKMVLAVMEDAEKKQVSQASVRLWMEELKALAYDAEDILDDYSYEIIRKPTQTGKVRKRSLFFRFKMAHKVKEINEKFNKIAQRKNDLGLQMIDSMGSSLSSHNTSMMENRETYSIVAANWKIVGRENDKTSIIKKLLDTNSCLVLAIVGLGGMGKTTMAQLVYNDEVVQKHFQIKIWICVSDPFDVKKLLKNIVNSIGNGKKYNDAATMDDIVLGLQDSFREKKFLLVLDDVWNENHEDWYKFKTPFMVGAEGSKILVTTRSMDVASIMIDKFMPYQLGILNEDDCWLLFKEIAFGSAAGAIESPKLVKIGNKMVGRCGGLPIAVIFLGSLMRSKKKEEEWKNIRDTKIWHESNDGKKSKHKILPSLRLSYDYLPSHLKQCFSYCCLFPKDWKIKRETLIRLWMAEGFLIKTPGENEMSMEEIGNEYFHNLLCNFFFQDAERNSKGDIITCKMHDLVHDLARSVVGKNECLIVERPDDIGFISEATRRLNLVNLEDGEMLPKVLEALKKAKNLRTVFVVNKQKLRFDIGNAFKENKRLRVLDLSESSITSESTSSSSSIGGLKHLRYLDVMTESTSSSASIGGLKHLRYLASKGACFPKGIGRLSFLQTLTEFNVGDEKKKQLRNVSVIQELEGLNFLSGDLRINHLQNVTSGTYACRANLKEKKNLRSLNLSWSRGSKSEGDHHHGINNNHEAVLEGLRPHPNLRTLKIEGYKGSKLPRWIEYSSCLTNLVRLNIYGGMYIDQVAGFGALPSLRYLSLNIMDRLKCIGKEFYYSAAAAAAAVAGSGEEASTTTTTAFPSLKVLNLSNMCSLKEWVVPVPPLSTTRSTITPTTRTIFPLLKEINLEQCPLLTTITPTTTIFPSLKVLKLTDMDGRAAETLVTNNLNYSLTSLTLWGIHNLITLPCQGLMENNNTLLSLFIRGCHQFEGFFPPNKDDDPSSLQVSSTSSSSSSSLQSLTLYDCPALKFYPNVRSLTSLRKLVIQECKESKSLQDELNCLSSSSSSSSSLDHLEHVKIMKNNATLFGKTVFVFEWRKSE